MPCMYIFSISLHSYSKNTRKHTHRSIKTKLSKIYNIYLMNVLLKEIFPLKKVPYKLSRKSYLLKNDAGVIHLIYV